MHDEVGHSQEAKREIQALFPGNVPFDTPKPTKLLKQIITVGAGKDAIIMDFFSGSASTADAVMQLNESDGGHRKYMMVQVEEKIDNEGYLNSKDKTIADIGIERIKRAAEKIKAETNEVHSDFGFRVFKVDESNMNDVYYAAGDYTQDMLSMMETNVKDGRTDLDLLFGCLLEWGLPLSLPYKSEQIDGCTVHTYNDGDLIACFDESIPDSVIREVAKRQPLRAVFRDGSFKDSPSKINVGEIFKMLAPDTRVKVI